MKLLTTPDSIYADETYYVCRLNRATGSLEFWNRRRNLWQSRPSGCNMRYQLTAMCLLEHVNDKQAFIANSAGNKVLIGFDRYHRQISNLKLIA